MKRLLPLVLLALLLGGCATLDKNECLQANWTDLGARDGQSGYSPARLEEHREACREYGIVPDDRSYLAGREQGLRYYCTPETGFREGRRGASYQRVCPLAAEADFLLAYDHGRELYQVEQDMNALRSRIDELERALDDPALAREQRRGYHRELDDLYRELAAARRHMDRLEDDLR